MPVKTRSRTFRAAVQATPIDPILQYVVDRFESLKSEGANDKGKVFDFIYCREKDDFKMDVITGFFKHPNIGETKSKKSSPLPSFPVIAFAASNTDPYLFPYGYCHVGFGVDRKKNLVELGSGGPETITCENQLEIDTMIAAFVLREMAGHPARERLAEAVQKRGLTPLGQQPPVTDLSAGL